MEIKNVQANNLTTDYLNFCLSRKNLDQKTIESYTIDLRQYFEFTMESAIELTNKKSIEQYIDLPVSYTHLDVYKRQVHILNAPI